MADNSIEEELASLPFFEGMKPEFLRFLAEHARRRELNENDVLFSYDAPAKTFYVLSSGRVSIEVAAIEGPPLEMQELNPGAVLGWSWLIPPYRWSFQARADAPGEIIEIDGETVRDRCESDPAFGYDILKRFSSLMSERLDFARTKMMEEWSPPGFA